MSDQLCIVQTIPTIQGEGVNSGVPSLLIRIAGCNLNCAFCDTKWANEEDVDKEPTSFILNDENSDEYYKKIMSLRTENKFSNVMITGGEPLLYTGNSVFQNLLIFCLNAFDLVEIETNGVFLDDLVFSIQEWAVGNISNLKLNISPKLNTAWYSDKSQFDRMKANCKCISETKAIPHVLKFVDNGKPNARAFMEEFIQDIKADPKDISLMPLTPPRPKVGESYLKYLGQYRINCLHTLKYCMENGYRLVPRIHVFLFEDEFEKF
jgi:organic radical activating enzyme